jgi:RHS repeat-associated protein
VQKEAYLYGSSRLGVRLLDRDPTEVLLDGQLPAKRQYTRSHYELSNHLGNVLTTVTGRKLGIDINNNGSGVDYYKSEIVQASDYYPFGSEMPGRKYENSVFLGTNRYRYGFNGKELDKSGEFGSLTHYDYGFRIYNPSIGKFLSVDPLTKSYPWYTPYQFAGNMPIWASDLDGLEPDLKHKGNSQTVNGVDYHKNGSDWIISKLNISYSDFEKALANITRTLNNYIDLGSLGSFNDSEIGGGYNINGLPLKMTLNGEGKLNVFTETSPSISVKGIELGSVAVTGFGLEYDIKENSICSYSGFTLNALLLQFESKKYGKSNSKFDLFFGGKYSNESFTLNFRTNLEKHSKLITSTFNSLDPSKARNEYLQYRMDLLGRSKPSVPTIETVNYELKRYVIHWQLEGNENKFYKFYQGSPEFENLSKNGSKVFEKLQKTTNN